MRRVLTVAPILALLAVGCSLQKGFNRGEMESALRSANPMFVSSTLTVEEIEKLKPQINLPVRLAVAPPTVSTTYARWRGDEPDS